MRLNTRVHPFLCDMINQGKRETSYWDIHHLDAGHLLLHTTAIIL